MSDRLVLELEGELDLATAALLTSAVDEADGSPAVVLDLTKVEFVDSTGLRAIFTARRSATEAGRRFAVTEGSAQVQRLLEITRLGDHLDTIPDPDSALP